MYVLSSKYILTLHGLFFRYNTCELSFFILFSNKQEFCSLVHLHGSELFAECLLETNSERLESPLILFLLIYPKKKKTYSIYHYTAVFQKNKFIFGILSFLSDLY